MKNKLFCFLGIIAVLSVSSAQAYSMDYGWLLDGGYSFGGATYKSSNISRGTEIGVNGNVLGSLFVGMDFGDERDTLRGFYIVGGYGVREIILEGPSKKTGDGKPMSASDRDGMKYVGVTFGIGAKLMFAYFNSGCMYSKIGCDGIFFTVKDPLPYATKGEHEELDKKLNDFNLAAKLEVGVEFWDQVLFFGVGTRCFFLEQFIFDEKEKEDMKKHQIEMSLGKWQVDANLFLGINFGKIGSGDSKIRSEKSLKRGGKK